MQLVPSYTWFPHCYTFLFSCKEENYKETCLLIWTGGSPPQRKEWHILVKERPFFWITAEDYCSPADWTTGFSRCTWEHSSRPAWQQRSAHPLSAGRFLLFLSPWSLFPACPGVLWFLAFWTGNSHEKKLWEFFSKCKHSLYVLASEFKTCPSGVQGHSLLAPPNTLEI